MKTYVITKNEVEGLHYWKDAPEKTAYLRSPHRHIFIIRCWFKVKNNDREIEIIKMQNLIYNYIQDKYGSPAMFGSMSCEMIAEEILCYFEQCYFCEVLEDGYGGAVVEK